MVHCWQKKYEVKGYPAYLFLNGDGELIHKSGGAMPAESFIKAARAALGEDILAGVQTCDNLI